ncbi:hypothetical protein GCM10022408_00080 [Hymenobacter fastidiosus]|uniref:DUF551 domain-containing protein n=1 Tax=Hymenobacter fastidiosus TaxID=486264 RepID=A0ABP7R9R2_9BACT
MEWITRAEQLPTPNQRVLVYVPSAWFDIIVAQYKPGSGSKHAFIKPDSNGVERYVKGVTHWMPLPPAP